MTPKEVRDWTCRVILNRKHVRYEGRTVGVGIDKLVAFDNDGNREELLNFNDVVSVVCSNTNMTFQTDNKVISLDLEV